MIIPYGQDNSRHFSELFTQSTNREELSDSYASLLKNLDEKRTAELAAIQSSVKSSGNALEVSKDAWQREDAVNSDFHRAAVDLRLEYGRSRIALDAKDEEDSRMVVRTPEQLGRAVSQYADELRNDLWQRSLARESEMARQISSGTVTSLERIELREQVAARELQDRMRVDQQVRDYRDRLYNEMLASQR